MLTLIPVFYRWIALAILIAALAIGIPLAIHHHDAKQQDIGYQKAQGEFRDAALKEQQAKAREGLRRLEQQDANQREQDRQLAVARADAERNADDADRVREQSASAARQWAARLADTPTGEDLAAAGKAIAVCSDVRSRMDDAAGQLATFADASRAAGIKCVRDYESLTPR